jgi:O-antigen ligase
VRRVVLASTMSLVIIVFHLFLNELIEVDKIGSVFFICLAMLVRTGTWLEEGVGSEVSSEVPREQRAPTPLLHTQA